MRFIAPAAVLVVLAIVLTGCADPRSVGGPGIRPVLSPIEQGEVPDDTTVYDTDVPAVARLDPDLRIALTAAADRAAGEDVTLRINSGWRSPELQERLLRDAVETYGSREEASRWVASSETSAHVSGDAVDVGPFDGAYWLDLHGAEFGLCRIYVNEPWHFELRPEAAREGCPSQYLDPTEDPRMAG